MLARRARIAPLVWLLLLGCASGGAVAQQTPPAPAPAPEPAAGALQTLTILIVDVQSLLQNSKAAKMVRQQIEQKRAEYAKEISHQEDALRQERDALQRQQASLSPAQLNQKGRDFQKKVNELDRNVQSKRQALERSNGDALEKIQGAMVKIITDIAKVRKANLVFQRTELVIWDQAFDITDEVLQKLDQQMPTLTVTFVAPVPVNTPAGDGGDQPAEAAPAPAKKSKHK